MHISGYVSEDLMSVQMLRHLYDNCKKIWLSLLKPEVPSTPFITHTKHFCLCVFGAPIIYEFLLFN